MGKAVDHFASLFQSAEKISDLTMEDVADIGSYIMFPLLVFALTFFVCCPRGRGHFLGRALTPHEGSLTRSPGTIDHSFKSWKPCTMM